MSAVAAGASGPPGAAPGPARRSETELRAVALAAPDRLADADAREVLVWAAAEFGTAWAVASAMQDSVLTHLASSVAPGVDVLFLDTGYHFPQTLTVRDEVAARYPVRVRSLTPEQTPAEQDAAHGPDLFASNPDLCCLLRKATPLDAALQGYEAWATGLRRVDSPGRAGTPIVSFDEAHGVVKLAPLAAWTDERVAAYEREHTLVRHPLVDQGYPSIGCAPCTRAVRPGQDPRAGRWAGVGKTECGIHR